MSVTIRVQGDWSHVSQTRPRFVSSAQPVSMTRVSLTKSPVSGGVSPGPADRMRRMTTPKGRQGHETSIGT